MVVIIFMFFDDDEHEVKYENNKKIKKHCILNDCLEYLVSWFSFIITMICYLLFVFLIQ